MKNLSSLIFMLPIIMNLTACSTTDYVQDTADEIGRGKVISALLIPIELPMHVLLDVTNPVGTTQNHQSRLRRENKLSEENAEAQEDARKNLPDTAQVKMKCNMSITLYSNVGETIRRSAEEYYDIRPTLSYIGRISGPEENFGIIEAYRYKLDGNTYQYDKQGRGYEHLLEIVDLGGGSFSVRGDDSMSAYPAGPSWSDLQKQGDCVRV